MFKAILLPAAKRDIQDAADWYNSKQKGLGKKFTVQIRKKVTFLQKNPQAVAIRYSEIRTIVLDVFPFMIHYFIDEVHREIVISAIFHTSRDPDLWKKR